MVPRRPKQLGPTVFQSRFLVSEQKNDLQSEITVLPGTSYIKVDSLIVRWMDKHRVVRG